MPIRLKAEWFATMKEPIEKITEGMVKDEFGISANQGYETA
ncbi:hypothetical protein [Edaphobacter aggregans]|nr:hypothetical protein [Edaphobacter aggregans]